MSPIEFRKPRESRKENCGVPDRRDRPWTVKSVRKAGFKNHQEEKGG